MLFLDKILAFLLIFGTILRAENGVLVKDLALNLRKPLQLTALVCWNESQRFSFYKTVSRFFQIQILDDKRENFPSSLNEHHNLLIVDANCEVTKNLLLNFGQQLYLRNRWIILNVDGLDYFKDLPVLASSEIFFFQQNGEEYLIKQGMVCKLF